MISRIRSISITVLVLVFSVTAVAGEIRVATLNCLLLFDPRIDHVGKVDDAERMTPQQFEEKLTNLASLIKGYQVIGLQETGGKTEISALATRAGMSWAFAHGSDTATGEEVGLLYKLPGWTVASQGRVRELDRILSKHLLVEASLNQRRVSFLVVHLIRPIGNQAEKHKKQLSAIGEWMQTTQSRDPKSVVVVMGDTNSTLIDEGRSLFGPGIEAGQQIRFTGTHVTNKPYDRLVFLGPASWANVEILKPPYGPRPVAAVRRVWTDHFLLGAVLHFPDS